MKLSKLKKDAIIYKCFKDSRPQLRFIEKYYEDKLGFDITINLSEHNSTSYFMFHKRSNSADIVIAKKNLENLLEEKPKLFVPLFYTLVLHEIGHALYSTNITQFTPLTNILEDMRIERQISKWNSKVKFEVLRYAIIDKSFNNTTRITTEVEAELGLLRTVNNKKIIRILGDTKEKLEIVNQILTLANQYADCDYSKAEEMTYLDKINYDIHELVIKLIYLVNQTKEEKEAEEKKKQEQSENSESSNDSETDSEDTQISNDSEEDSEEEEDFSKEEMEESETDPSEEPFDIQTNQTSDEDNEKSIEGKSNKENSETETSENEEDGDSEQDSSAHGGGMKGGTGDNEENSLDKRSQREIEEEEDLEDELENELNKIIEVGQYSFEEWKSSPEIGVLINTSAYEENYKPFSISAFTTARRTGIKGSNTSSRYSGNAKQLSMQRYSRNKFTVNEKLFNKNMDELGNGGKSTKVLFYLDISSSMSRDERLKNSIRYLQSFYDKMHKYVEIRFMVFGMNTYEITRHELEYYYLVGKMQNATRPQPVKTKANEEVIFITDGCFGTTLPQAYLDKANFLVLGMDKEDIDYFFPDIKNIHSIQIQNYAKGFEKATEHIKKLLRKGC